MKYKGIKLKEITEPQLFNPPKPMLVWDSDDENHPCELKVCAIVDREGFRVITERSAWRHCAEIPEEPKQKLATYRELAKWLAQGNGEMRRNELDVFTDVSYDVSMANDSVVEEIVVRKWSDTEWNRPTREYLGLEG